MRAGARPPRPPWHRRPALWIWLLGVAATALVTARSHYVADLSAFLPSAPSPEQAALLDQLTRGSTSRLVLVGIEGGDAASRSATSMALANHMRAAPTLPIAAAGADASLRARTQPSPPSPTEALFDSVNNGDLSAWRSAGPFLFDHRYQLSPAVDAERFTASGLRAAIDDTVALLGTPAGALVKPVLDRDPTGETLRMAEAMQPGQAPRMAGGVWVSRRAERAVIVATTRAGGADLDGQERAIDSVRAGFAALTSAPAPAVAAASSTAASSGPRSSSSATIPSPTVASATAAPLRLVITGAGTFGVSARAQIRGEVERLAVFGSIGLIAWLLLAFGSVRGLAIAMLPVGCGVLAGIAAVSLGFGTVHGLTLGFGTTLIGEAVDYAIYYLIQARRSEASFVDQRPRAEGVVERPSVIADASPSSATHRPDAHASDGASHWLRHSWPTVRLGLWTSLCGFAALVFSGFPGLAQLGVFSVAGLAAAALTTRHVFPIFAPDGAPGTAMRERIGRFTARAAAWLPKLRSVLAVASALAVIALVVLPSPWRGHLAGLSPISADALALDAELRADLGAADAGTLVVVSAGSEARALELAEAAGMKLDALVASGRLQGYDSPARLLPSPRTQRERLASLPDVETLQARLFEATADGPLSAARLQPFIDEVNAARVRPVLDRAALAATPLAAAVDALLIAGDAVEPVVASDRAVSGAPSVPSTASATRDTSTTTTNHRASSARPWRALLTLHGTPSGIDIGAIRNALAGVPEAQVIDVQHELDALYAGYLNRAALQALAGAIAVLLLLAAYLRSARRLAMVALPITASVLIVLAAATASGAALGILHLVGLLLVVAIGSNYALFFDHLRRQPAVDVDTLASLLLANLTAVWSFGLLALSNIAVLQAIGAVVAPGALLSLLLSAAWLGDARAHGKIVTS